MAVAPDILLTQAASVASRASPVKSLQDTSSASDDKASSFADVYAQENRSTPTERPAASTKPTRDKVRTESSDHAQARRSRSDDGSDSPKVADDGKALPADSAKTADQAKDDSKSGETKDKPDTSIDPLLALGLGTTPPTTTPAVDPATLVASATQGLQNAANTDPDLAKLNQAQAVQLDLNPAGAAEQGINLPGLTLNADGKLQLADKSGKGDGKADAKTDMASLLAGLTSGQSAGEGEGKSLDATLAAATGGEAGKALTEAVGEAKPEVPKENFASKLEGLAQALNSSSTITSRAVNATVPGQAVAVPQNGWTEAVVDRVMWMSSQNLKSADIQMEPADLGKLEVRINMTPDQTQVTFASQNANVREALDSQQHRLREMLNQQGMNQVNVNVSDQSLARNWQGQQQQGGNGDGGRSSAAGRGGQDGDDEPMVSGVSEIRARTATQGLGLVDYYA
ncbi:MAG: Flagellar hook-length control protein [Pseudomonas citronellolis]|nr:MAG: Flagellar hook-length control protein [Pseudomonas citronellolis]